MKSRGETISMLTAYDATMARLLDQAGIDVLLVGDSLGMVILGGDDTLEVTMDDMVRHTRAVRRGAQRALVVADMPFMSYQASIADAVRNAGRLMQEGGAMAVKLEGGRPVIETVERLVSVGIPVMGHLGLLPQSVHQLGGYKRQADHEGSRRRPDPGRGGARIRRRLRGGSRVHSRRPGARSQRPPAHPHHRNRLRPRLRRAGAGELRSARSHREDAVLRQEIRAVSMLWSPTPPAPS